MVCAIESKSDKINYNVLKLFKDHGFGSWCVSLKRLPHESIEDAVILHYCKRHPLCCELLKNVKVDYEVEYNKE